MKIILCGACGKMGRAVTELAEKRGEQVVYGADLAPAPMPYPVAETLSNAPEADVLIDFSNPNGIEERLAWCTERAMPAVLGTTGFNAEQLSLIKRHAAQIPLFQSGNLSLGISLLQMLAKRTASALGEDFDVEIIERHHSEKKDAPSGTALMLAQSVNEGRETQNKSIYGRHGTEQSREKGEIGIHAVRGGNLVGEHEVTFAGEDEIITLAHSARSRFIFANGALKAAEFLIGKPAGLYDMHDLLNSL